MTDENKPTGAERYLAGRMADPEYRAAYESATEAEIGADHRIVFESIIGGWDKWKLECLHEPEGRWHVYCDDCDSADCTDRYHHDECVLTIWWIEYDFQLVADLTGPIVTPIYVRSTTTRDAWILTPL